MPTAVETEELLGPSFPNHHCHIFDRWGHRRSQVEKHMHTPVMHSMFFLRNELSDFSPVDSSSLVIIFTETECGQFSSIFIFNGCAQSVSSSFNVARYSPHSGEVLVFLWERHTVGRHISVCLLSSRTTCVARRRSSRILMRVKVSRHRFKIFIA